jgi:predicted lactoylglutathione lyase
MARIRVQPRVLADTAACMIVDENIFVMLLVEGRFRAESHGSRPSTRAACTAEAFRTPTVTSGS